MPSLALFPASGAGVPALPPFLLGWDARYSAGGAPFFQVVGYGTPPPVCNSPGCRAGAPSVALAAGTGTPAFKLGNLDPWTFVNATVPSSVNDNWVYLRVDYNATARTAFAYAQPTWMAMDPLKNWQNLGNFTFAPGSNPAFVGMVAKNAGTAFPFKVGFRKFALTSFMGLQPIQYLNSTTGLLTTYAVSEPPAPPSPAPPPPMPPSPPPAAWSLPQGLNITIYSQASFIKGREGGGGG